VQQKITILNSLLAVFSMALAALSAVIWVQPQYPSRVDPRAVQPSGRTLETVTLERPVQDRGQIETVVATNLFREERAEYVPPKPAAKPAASGAQAPPVPSVTSLPPPSVTLRGVFMANGTRVAFLEGKYPVQGAGGPVQEKPLKRKGYYLGDAIGTYKIKSIEKTQVSLANAQGSVMTLSMPRRLPEQEITQQGTHLFHKDKNARKNRQVEVEKVLSAPPVQRTQPRVVTPGGQAQPGTVRLPQRSREPRAQAAPPAPQSAPPRVVSPPAVITPPRISGASSPAPAPTPAPPHISGSR